MSLIEELHTLPSEWGYVAVGHSKRPYQAKWQDNPLTKEQLTAIDNVIKSEKAPYADFGLF